MPPDNHVVKLTYGGTLLRPETSKDISLNYLSCKAKWSGLFLETDNEEIQVDRDIRKKQKDTIIEKGPQNIILEKKKEQLLLSDFFEVKRGIATGANKYFILSQKRAAEYVVGTQYLLYLISINWPVCYNLFTTTVKEDINPNG